MNRRFANDLDLPYPILSDPTREVARAYGVVGGVLPWAARWTFYIGADGRIAYIDKHVNPSTAGRDVVERLATLAVPLRDTGAAGTQ